MKIVKETIRKYYKYTYSSWTQPVLSANGTIGGDSFAVSTTSVYAASNDIYKGFDNNTNTYYAGANGAKPIITMYNPLPLKITNIQVTNRISGTDSVEIRDYKINVSNDNINYTTILTGTNTDSSYGGVWNINLSSNTNAYKYYQIEVLSIGSVNYCEFAEIKITATQRTVTTGTSSDYDFYEDVEVYEAVKKTVRKYYKYDTQNPQYNYTPVGTITNNNGVLSGFTTSNYASISDSFNPQSSEWEMIIPYITTNISSAQYILGTDNYGVCIGINDSSKARIYLSSNNSSWDIADGTTSAISLSANTQYYFKLTRTSSSYVLSVSTDKTNYTTHITVSSSATIPSSQLKFGVSRSNVQPATYGSIDLNDAQITVGGSIWWQGKTYPAIPATSSDYDFYKDVDVYEAVKF